MAEGRSDLAPVRPQVYADPRPAERFDRFHEYARSHQPDGLYTFVRVTSARYCRLVYRLRVQQVENVPAEGGVILAPNHFSHMDHWFIGVMLGRPVRFMAKSQLFRGRPVEAFLSHMGAFPIRRGHHDEEAFKTAFTILERGGCMLMYPEGGRSRTGGIAEPRPGVGRIALQSGVPVIPVAIHGSLGVRGWRKLRFPKVTVQYGEPLSFDVLPEPTREQQLEVATEIFKHVRAMYDALDAKGRRGVIKALREGITNPTEQKVPAEQSR